MASVFSYAEAAKGLTPAATAPQPEKASEQLAAEGAVDATASTTTASTQEKLGEPVSQHDDSTRPATAATTDATDLASTLAPVPQPVQDQAIAPGHVSPTFGADSTATLLKDDDPSNGFHDGSESTTWEKISQDSQTADKVSKADLESNDSKSSHWEHIAPPELKDAPIPTVNPWHKRAQDRVSKTVVAAPTAKDASATTSRPGDAGVTHGKKKSRPADASGSRAEKFGEGKERNDGAAARRYQPSSEAKALARMPPPASDAVSWPTPDLAAKPEEKKRSISGGLEPVDQSEKDKSASSKHGKTEWVSMPFVPTPVFNTPLPTGRRGGRPGGRGAREGGSVRGGSLASPVDQPERSPSTQRGDASVDGSRADAASVKQGPSNRQKRMSNAGQPRPRELRRGGGAGAGEEGREGRHPKTFDQESVATRDTSKDSRRPSHAADAREFGRRNPVSPGGPRTPTTNGTAADGTPLSNESGPRSSERRGEFGYHAHRENGPYREARSERGGRGGFRGRGGHGPVHGHQGPYSNGIGYAYGGGYSPNKAGHDQRQPSQGFNPGRDGRHVRTSSRTQAGQPGHFQPRYMNNAMAMAYPPVSPDMAAGYGFVPGMPMQFYHPYQDQQGLVGMIMEQMRYWFSLDNLLRDMFLRKRMDDNGFVPLSFLMPWKRMQVLTSDIKMVRFACQNVPQIELRVDTEGNEYVRKAQDWEKWVMPLEERHEEAQKAAAPQLFPIFSQPDGVHQHSPGLPQQQHQQPPRSGPKAPPMRTMNDSPSHQSASGTEELTNGHSGAASGDQTPLSATVPEFKPEGRLAAKVNETFGVENFADTRVDGLSIIDCE